MNSFDRNEPLSDSVVLEIEPFGVVQFNELGELSEPEHHKDLLEFIENALAQVPVGCSGFVTERSGTRLYFDSTGRLDRAEAITLPLVENVAIP